MADSTPSADPSNHNTINLPINSADDGFVEIKIKTLDSQTFTFNVPKHIPIFDLKERIATDHGVPKETQRLIYRGRVLKDDQLLSSYNIDHGDALHLVARQPPTTQPSESAGPTAGRESGTNDNAPQPQIGRNIFVGTFDVPTNYHSRLNLSRARAQGNAELSGERRTTESGQSQQPSQGQAQGHQAESQAQGQARPESQAQGQPREQTRDQGQGQTWDHMNVVFGTSPNFAQVLSSMLNFSTPQHTPVSSQQGLISVMDQYVNRLELAFQANEQSLLRSTEANSLFQNHLFASENSERSAQVQPNRVGQSNQQSQGNQPNQTHQNNTAGNNHPSTPDSVSSSQLAEMARRIQALVSGPVSASISRLAQELDSDRSVLDASERAFLQSSITREANTIQQIGALLLELGHDALSVRLGSVPGEASVQAAYPLYINPYGPNPVFVQPNVVRPFMNTVFNPVTHNQSTSNANQNATANSNQNQSPTPPGNANPSAANNVQFTGLNAGLRSQSPRRVQSIHGVVMTLNGNGNIQLATANMPSGFVINANQHTSAATNPNTNATPNSNSNPGNVSVSGDASASATTVPTSGQQNQQTHQSRAQPSNSNNQPVAGSSSSTASSPFGSTVHSFSFPNSALPQEFFSSLAGQRLEPAGVSATVQLADWFSNNPLLNQNIFVIPGTAQPQPQPNSQSGTQSQSPNQPQVTDQRQVHTQSQQQSQSQPASQSSEIPQPQQHQQTPENQQPLQHQQPPQYQQPQQHNQSQGSSNLPNNQQQFHIPQFFAHVEAPESISEYLTEVTDVIQALASNSGAISGQVYTYPPDAPLPQQVLQQVVNALSSSIPGEQMNAPNPSSGTQSHTSFPPTTQPTDIGNTSNGGTPGQTISNQVNVTSSTSFTPSAPPPPSFPPPSNFPPPSSPPTPTFEDLDASHVGTSNVHFDSSKEEVQKGKIPASAASNNSPNQSEADKGKAPLGLGMDGLQPLPARPRKHKKQVKQEDGIGTSQTSDTSARNRPSSSQTPGITEFFSQLTQNLGPQSLNPSNQSESRNPFDPLMQNLSRIEQGGGAPGGIIGMMNQMNSSIPGGMMGMMNQMMQNPEIVNFARQVSERVGDRPRTLESVMDAMTGSTPAGSGGLNFSNLMNEMMPMMSQIMGAPSGISAPTLAGARGSGSGGDRTGIQRPENNVGGGDEWKDSLSKEEAAEWEAQIENDEKIQKEAPPQRPFSDSYLSGSSVSKRQRTGMDGTVKLLEEGAPPENVLNSMALHSVTESSQSGGGPSSLSPSEFAAHLSRQPDLAQAYMGMLWDDVASRLASDDDFNIADGATRFPGTHQFFSEKIPPTDG